MGYLGIDRGSLCGSCETGYATWVDIYIKDGFMGLLYGLLLGLIYAICIYLCRECMGVEQFNRAIFSNDVLRIRPPEVEVPSDIT